MTDQTNPYDPLVVDQAKLSSLINQYNNRLIQNPNGVIGPNAPTGPGMATIQAWSAIRDPIEEYVSLAIADKASDPNYKDYFVQYFNQFGGNVNNLNGTKRDWFENVSPTTQSPSPYSYNGSTWSPTPSNLNQYTSLMNPQPQQSQPQQPVWNASIGAWTNNGTVVNNTQPQAPMNTASTMSVPQPQQPSPGSPSGIGSMMNYSGQIQGGNNPNPAYYQPFQGASNNNYGYGMPSYNQMYNNAFGQLQNQNGLTSLFGRR